MKINAKDVLFVLGCVGVAMLGKRFVLIPIAEKVPAVAPAVALLDKVIP